MDTDLDSPTNRIDRFIALVKPKSSADDPAAHALQVFDSVLWVFKGTMRSNWVTASVDQAAVVVVHHAEQSERIAHWRKQGKQIVVISTDERQASAAPRTLVYPFKADRVLRLLNELEADLFGDTPAAVEKVTQADNKHIADPWSFIETLGTLRGLNNADVWMMATDSLREEFWLRGDGRQYSCTENFARKIRSGTLKLSGFTFAARSVEVPAELMLRAGIELLWFGSYHVSAALSPALATKTKFRLMFWPDFGALRIDSAAQRAAQLRIVASLDAASHSITSLIAAAEATQEEVVRTLNALSTCKCLLATSRPAAKTLPVATQQRGGFRSMLRGIRKHLGLGE
jgi:hypothetical protein